MKYIRSLVFVLFLVTTFSASAQQRPLSSLNMFSLFDANAAYSGNSEALSIAARFRSQWVGFEGAPTGQSVSVHSPISYPALGAGLKIYRETIGAREQLQALASCSYHFSTKQAHRPKYRYFFDGK